jgi:hypothetical protein
VVHGLPSQERHDGFASGGRWWAMDTLENKRLQALDVKVIFFRLLGLWCF